MRSVSLYQTTVQLLPQSTLDVGPGDLLRRGVSMTALLRIGNGTVGGVVYKEVYLS